MRLLIADIEPIKVGRVVDLTILDYIVGVHEIAGFKISIGPDCSWGAES